MNIRLGRVGRLFALRVLKVLATALAGASAAGGLCALTAVRPVIASVRARYAGDVSLLVRVASETGRAVLSGRLKPMAVVGLRPPASVLVALVAGSAA